MTQKVKPSTLADTSVAAGTYGGQNQIPVFTVDQQGRLTYSANVTPIITSDQIAGLISDSQISSISNTKITGTLTATTLSANSWTISTSPAKIVFAYNGTNVFSIANNGNMVVSGEIFGFGTP